MAFFFVLSFIYSFICIIIIIIIIQQIEKVDSLMKLQFVEKKIQEVNGTHVNRLASYLRKRIELVRILH